VAHLGELVRALLADRAERAISQRGGVSELAQSVVDRRRDPWTIAEELVGAL